MVPSAPTATPCGSPGSSQRLTIFRSRVGTGVSGWALVDEARMELAIANSAIAAALVIDREGKLLDDGVGKEPLADLPELTFDLFPRLACVCKRDAKQLAGADIFHALKTERADRMLNRFPLRVENGRFELDDDGRVHGCEFYAVAPPAQTRVSVPHHPAGLGTTAAGRESECGTDTLVCAATRCS